MAVPDSVNLHNLTGTFNLNKKLSDSTDEVLQMQGVSWLVRQAIKYSNVTAYITEYVDEAGLTHIDIKQVSTGNVHNTEERTLDFEFREKEDRIFGKIKGRSRFLKLDDVEDEYQKQDWDEKFLADGNREVMQAYVEGMGKNPNWIADQIWGFAVVDGQKRHVRRIVARKGDKVHRIRLVFDWVVEKTDDELAYGPDDG